MKTRLVKTGLAVLSALKADRWLARPANWAGTALMFHRVRPQPSHDFRPNAHLEITPDFLEKVVLRLRELKIAIVDLDEAADRLSRKESVSRERFAVLTFDDGYADNYTHALPVLKRHDAPFTIFVSSGMIDGSATGWWMVLEEVLRLQPKVVLDDRLLPIDLPTGSLREKKSAFFKITGQLLKLGEHDRDDAIRRLGMSAGVDPARLLAENMMTWSQLQEIAGESLVTLGSHTVNHFALARLGDEDARREILGGIRRMTEMLGTTPRHFAYPYGGMNEVADRDLKLVADLGVKVALTTRRGMLTVGSDLNSVAWPRLSVNGHFQDRRYLDILLSGVPFFLESWNPGSLLSSRPRHLAARVGRPAPTGDVT